MAVFTDCVVVLNVKELSIKEKNKLKTAIKNNNGIISYLVNRQCTHVVASDLNTMSSCRLKAIQKYNIPVVNLDYIPNCIKEGKLLDVSCYKPCEPTPCANDDATEMERNIEIPQEEIQDNAENFRFISAQDSNIPPFPPDFEVVKYSILEKNENGVGAIVVLELQVSQKNGKFPFRISSHFEQSQQQQKKFVFTSIAEEAEEAYDWCIKKLVAQEFTIKVNELSAVLHLTSEKLQQLIIEGALNTSRISNEVGVFVEMVWAEAQGHLEDQLINPTSITLNDITRAEGILLQLKKAIDDKIETEILRDLMCQFYSILLIIPETDSTITKRKISEKQDLCQLVRDVVNASEATSWTPVPSSLTKYHALRCQVEYVDPNSDEFLCVKNQLLNTNQSTCSVKILQIFHVARLSETKNFQSQLGNNQQLYHASSGSNFVGILSRGLLLPKTVVEDYGVERTDFGNLGSGIYFSNSISTSIKYSKPNKIDGSRLLVICDVSLGKCKNYYKKDLTLTAAPAEYSSVHGICKTENIVSEFEDDEFVVYSTSQVKIKYVVQFCIGEDQLKPFHPLINVAPEETIPSILTSEDVDIDDLEAAQDPLKNVTSGLQDSAGNVIALQEIHIEAKLMDLVAQVMVFQSYTNPNTFPIEAKYVFPLDDAAAVCGFEAFINGKHIIGQVKEKQQAHHEYRQAIKQGHGAYLMDQATAEVFTISIGNLPPNANVIIKITYITELSVDQEYISFLLPGSLTSQQRDKALQEKTQESLKKIDVKQQEPACGFSLNLSIEMPFEIKEITSPTHNMKIKRTDCTAVISVEQNSCLGTGFQLLILLAEIHAPRMWVENNPEKDSQACMLAFYPEFDVGTLSDCEAIICLDCSYSMRGLALEQAKKVALLLLRYLPTTCRFNVITFGTDYQELFHCSQQRNSEDAVKAARKFILSVHKPMGNTDFWRPLLSLNLLAPSKRIRNILLISDGHIQNEALTLKTVHQNIKHTRIFTCGVGSTVNRHILRILAQYGGGAHEVFDKNTKFSWKEKVLSQVNRVTQPGCSSISVKWERFNLNVPDPVQAPAQIHSVFSNSRLLIYGFVPHCTQATLSAVINNQEVSTIVSTTELQKTKGKILHRLTARALIGDYENGSLHTDESEHEMKKSTLKSYIIELSKEYSLVTQFTSFVAIEERYEQEEDLILSPSIQELAAKESVDILSYMDWDENFKHQNFKLRASKRELMEKWEVPNKFTKAIIGDDDYDDYYYDEMQSNTSPLVGMGCSSSINTLSTSSEMSPENSDLLGSLLVPLCGNRLAAKYTSMKKNIDEVQYLKYHSSGDELCIFEEKCEEIDSISLDAAFYELLDAAPISGSSAYLGSGFSATGADNKNSSLFGFEFAVSGAPIPPSSLCLDSDFSTSAAPIPPSSLCLDSDFSKSAGHIRASSGHFGSAFESSTDLIPPSSVCLNSDFSSSILSNIIPIRASLGLESCYESASASSAAPIPTSSVRFGSVFAPPRAPIPASSVHFGSAFAQPPAPVPASSVHFGSELPPPPAPVPASSVRFGSACAPPPAPIPASSVHFGSGLPAPPAPIPASSVRFGSAWASPPAPVPASSVPFGSAFAQPPAPIPESSVRFGSAFAPPPAPIPASSVPFGSAFAQLTAPIPASSVHFDSTFGPPLAPVPASSVHFGSGLPPPPAPIPASSVPFGSAFAQLTAPVPASSVHFDSTFGPPLAPVPASSLHFGSELPAPPAPIPASSVRFGSAFAQLTAPIPASSLHFGSELPAPPAPIPASSVRFGSAFAQPPAPIPASSVRFGSAFAPPPAPIPASSVHFGSGLPPPPPPIPASSVHFGSGLPPPPPPIPASSVHFGSGLPPPPPPIPASSVHFGSGLPAPPAPIPASSVRFGSAFAQPPAPVPESSVRFGSAFAQLTAPVPASSVHFDSTFGPPLAPVPASSVHFGSGLPPPPAPIPASSVCFGSAFAQLPSPVPASSVHFGSELPPPPAPVPASSVRFGSACAPPPAPIPASSVRFGSAFAQPPAPIPANSVRFGSAFAPPPAPIPASSVHFGSGLPPPPAPIPASSVRFGSAFAQLPSPVPASSVHFGSELPPPPAPVPASSVRFGSACAPPPAPIPASSVHFGSAFAQLPSPVPASSVHFGSELPPPPAPVPASSVRFGSACAPPPAPIPASSVRFGSAFAQPPAPIPANSVRFGSAFAPPPAPIPASSVHFDSELPPPPAPIPANSVRFGSAFAPPPAPIPASSVHFDSELPPPPAPIPASSVHFDSELPPPPAPIPASSVHCDLKLVAAATGRKKSFGLDSSVAASPPFGGPGVSLTTMSSARGSYIIGSPRLMAEDLTLSNSVRSIIHTRSSIPPPPPPPPPCPITLHSSSSKATALLGKSKGFGSELHVPAGSNGFRSVGLSASQDQNMANEKVLQQPPEETRLVTTDFHIFEMSTNFKGEKFKTSFQDPQFRSFRKLKKGREGVSSNSKIKMLAKNQRSFKKENEWPKKTGCFQKKKEDREKALRSKNCEIPWIKLLMCQNKTGYWNFTSDLGVLLEINVEYLTNVFLIERGIKSLGHRAAEEIVSLIATFLILQLIRFTNQLKGIKLTSLLCLDQTLDSRTACWHVEHVKKAIAWAKNTDRKYPTICSRLQLGRDWESATRQLLQIDSLKKGSPLQQLYNQEE